MKILAKKPNFIFSLISIVSLVILAHPSYGQEQVSYKILFLGDSLTEGYGIDKSASYPVVTAKILKEKGLKVEVVNGSISGSTTASGKSRLKWFAKARPDMVFLALGGNDALRGIKVESSKENLAAVIKIAQERNIKIFLAGMMAPPNYGPEYGQAFRQMYLDLEEEYKVPTMPFLLDGVAGEKKLNQEDGIHPNREGHKIMGQHVARFLLPHLVPGSSQSRIRSSFQSPTKNSTQSKIIK